MKWLLFLLFPLLRNFAHAQECNCQNGGICGTGNNTACECPSGTSGTLCESCDCQNGGICSSTGCQCPPNTLGDFCETVSCSCLHGGTCIGEPPICQCPPGTSGDQCEKLDECECLNGGTCRTDGETRCSCPPGTTGNLCEMFESCGGEACQNDSPCITASNGTMYCDCVMITIHDPTKHYAGQFCQYHATTDCGTDSFCVNGGVCRDKGDGSFHCECQDDWTGPYCETESQNRVDTNLTCSKTCLNGGKCRKIDDSQTIERCVCPTGFAGMRCEHSYEECGDGELICLHGTRCVPPRDESQAEWTCECKEGQHCQLHQSSMCSSTDVETTTYRGMTSIMYCVNDGVCITYEQKGRRYPACQCPPQYTGPHCEFLKSQVRESDTETNYNADNQSAGSIFGIFVACILVVVFIVVLYSRKKRQRTREKTAMIEAAHREADMMDEVDFDMEDVELL